MSRFFSANTKFIGFCLFFCLLFSTMAEAQTCSGFAVSSAGSIGVADSDNAIGGPNGTFANVNDLGDELILVLDDVLSAGETFNVTWRRNNGYGDNSATTDMVVMGSTGPLGPFTTLVTLQSNDFVNFQTDQVTNTLGAPLRYLKFTELTGNQDDFNLANVSYTNADCENYGCQSIDFETDGLGDPLLEGQYIDENTFAGIGFTVKSNTFENGDLRPLVIFNSSAPTGGDPDLGTPSSACVPGAPGDPVGTNSCPGGGSTNCEPENFILITEENPADANGDGLEDEPDDYAETNTTWEFASPITISTIKFIDDSEGSIIFTFSDFTTQTVALEGGCNNDAYIQSFDIGDVISFDLDLTTSGSIAIADFCFDDPTLPPCDLVAPVLGADQAVCSGTDPAQIEVVAPATGTGTINYQWLRSNTDCMSGFGPLPGATNATYNPDPITNDVYYKVITTIYNTNALGDTVQVCVAESNCIAYTITTTPQVSISAAGPFCVSNAAFQLVATPEGGTFSGNGVSATGLFDPAIAGAGTSTITYDFSEGACSGSATIDLVVTAPSAIILTKNASCVDGSVESDAEISITGVTDGDRVNFSIGTTYTGDSDYANAATIGTLPFSVVNNLTNPILVQKYTVRVFAGDSNCYKDYVVTVNEVDCSQNCVCTDYLYVTDPAIDVIHKFVLNNDGSIGSEIGSPWLPVGNIVDPHGVVAGPNGNLYSAQIVGSAETDPTTPTQLVQLSCDGTIADADFIPGWKRTLNVQVLGDFIYGIGRDPNGGPYQIYKGDLCTQMLVDSIQLPNAGAPGWGLSEGPTGILHFSQRFGTGGPQDHTIFSVDEDLTTFESLATVANVAGFSTHGIECDEFGNLYMVTTNNTTGETRMYKFDSDGNLLNTLIDDSFDTNGFGGAWGITYFQEVGKIYVGTLGEDCIAVINTGGETGAMSYEPILGIEHVPGAYAKAVYIVSECCPVDAMVTVDTTICNNPLGDGIDITTLLGCEGTYCEGEWSLDASSTGVAFDACALTLTQTMPEACATINYDGDGSGASQCGVFNVTFNVEFVTNEPPTITADQIICEDDDAATLTFSDPGSFTDPVTYQWQQSTTSCTEGFTDIGGATNVTYDPGVLIVTTYFRVVSTNIGSCSSGMCESFSNCVIITVNPLPTITLDPVSPLCASDAPITLTASPTSGTFSGPGVTGTMFDPSAANIGNNTISYTYTDPITSCINSESISISVLATPNAIISETDNSGTTANDAVICVGDDAVLTASGGAAYTWDNGLGTAPMQTVSPTTTTTYTVVVTGANGCTATVSQTIIVNPLPTAGVNVAETSGATDDDGAICTGDAVTLSATGGSTYLWDNGLGANAVQVVSPNITTTYSVTVTNANGCTDVSAQTITVNPLPTPDAGHYGPFCEDDSPITLTGSPSGGTFSGPGVTGNTFDPDNVNIGNNQIIYSYTDDNQCSNTDATTIIVNPIPTADITATDMSGSSPDDSIICAGDQATLTATGGTNYIWDNGLDGNALQSVDPAVTTTYSVTVTNGDGCTAVASQTIIVNPLPTAAIVTTDMSGTADDDGTICAGDAANFIASDGVSYQWDNSLGTNASQTVNPTTTTTYNVTVTNADGCTAVASQEIIVNPLPTPDAGTYGPYCVNDSPVTLAGMPAGGTFSGTGISGTNGTTFTPATAGVGTFTITYEFTDGNDCTASTTTDIVVNDVPTAAITATDMSGTTNDDATICVGDQATLTASGGTSYVWDNGLSGDASQTVSPAMTTTYNVTVTNGDGCTAVASQEIIVNPLPIAGITFSENSGEINDGEICIGDFVNLSASGGNTFEWDNGLGSDPDQSLRPLVTTTYTVTVTNSDGCTSVASQEIIVIPLPVGAITLTELSGQTPNDGTICIDDNVDLIVSGGDTYTWDNGLNNDASQTVNPTTSTTYNVTVTNSNGCTDVVSQEIIVVPLPSAGIDVFEMSGNSDNDGTICLGEDATITATGGVSYQWDNGLSNDAVQTVSPTTTTTYNVTVTNMNGCTAVTSQEIIVNTLPTPDAGMYGPYCVNDGPITLMGQPDGGKFSGTGVTINTFTPSTVGVGTFTITYEYTDGNGCLAIATTDIVVNGLPVTDITVTDMSGIDNNDGEICVGDNANLTASGEDSYVWSNNLGTDPSQIVTPISTTTYTVTVTNGNGCTAVSSTEIVVNPLPIGSIIIDETSGNMIDDGVICEGDDVTLMVSGGDTYLWDNSLGNNSVQNVSPTTTTTYNVTVTNSTGCTSVVSQEIIVNPTPIVEAISNPVCVGELLRIEETAGDATSWSWTGPNNFTSSNQVILFASATTANSGIYTVTIEDANGCVNSASVEAVVNSLPNVDPFGDEVCENETINLSEQGGDAVSWSWTGPDNFISTLQNPSIVNSSDLNEGTYTVEITDSNGCTNLSSANVIVNPNPIVSISDPTDVCLSEMDITFNGTPVPGAGTVGTFTTTAPVGSLTDDGNGSATLDVSVAGAGTFDVQYKYVDINGCTDSAAVSVDICDFDLALRKTINTANTAMPIMPGDTVVFDIKVFNQGTVDAFDIQINDYIPSGLILNDLNWTNNSEVATLNTSISTIAAGMSEVVTIEFIVSPTFSMTSITNNAEIAFATKDDDSGVNTPDSDSNPASSDGTSPDPNDNDILLEDGSDDYDLETITILPQVSIGSTVFLDVNNNGEFDATESVIPGISVSLFLDNDMNGVPDGSAIATTSTGTDGNYFFDELDPGNYIVGVTPPNPNLETSSVPTDITDNEQDNDDNGIQDNSGDIILSPSINLSPGTEPFGADEDGTGGTQDDTSDADGDMTVDFGLVPYVSIGSTVFGDADNNGEFNELTEEGIEGVTVNLYADVDMNGTPDNPSMPISTVMTDVLGNYFFGTLLPGNYVVGVEPLDSLPLSSTPTDINDNQQDNDDNGIQANSGDEIFSPSINLTGGAESEDTGLNPETGSGNTQDNANNQDANGDMTVDFGIYGTYDVALDKAFTTASSDPIVAGSTVNYTITITNEGTLDLFDIGVTDNIPTGLTLVVGGDFMMSAGEAVLANPISELAAGTDTVINISFTVDNDFLGTQIVNVAEVTSIENAEGEPVTDIDSAPDNEDGAPYEDDEDNETINIGQTFDLALVKVVNENQVLPLEPGQAVTFDILVINQGTIDATDVQVSDYIPSGLTINDGNWIEALDTARLVTPLAVTAGDTTTVSITFIVDADFTGESITNNAEIESAMNALDSLDVDSTPGDADGLEDPNNDDVADTNGGDDNDPATIPVDPYVSIGSTVFLDNNNDGLYDELNEDGIEGITVYVYESGDLTTPIDSAITDINGDYFIDSLLAGNYVVGVIPNGENPQSSEGETISDGTDNNDNGSQTNAGDEIFSNVVNLAPNTELEDEPGQGGGQDTVLSSTNDNDGDMTIDFGLVPYVSVGSTVFGDANNDGIFDETTEEGIEGITVNLYADANMDGVPDNPMMPIETVVTDGMGNYLFDSLAIGDYVIGVVPNDSLPLSSTGSTETEGVDNNDNGSQVSEGDEIFSNTFNLTGGSEPTGTETGQGNGQDDANSQDANGDMTIDFGVYGTYDVALDKAFTTASPDPIVAGSTVNYTITITNEGTLDLFDIGVTDNIPTGLTLVVGGDFMMSAGEAVLANPISELAAGTDTVLNISFTVDNDFMGTQIVNVAEVTNIENAEGEPVTDVDSAPDNEDGAPYEDDEDQEVININQTFDLALVKVVNENQVLPLESGQSVTFDILVINQGTIDATDVQVSDYIPSGLTINDGNWIEVLDTARLVTPLVVKAGDTTTVSITFIVDADFTGESITNNAEIESAMNALDSLDVDSTPGDADGLEDPNNDDVADTNGGDDNDPATIPVDPYVSIGSTVFLDNNNDGLYDELNEDGVEGITVYVYESGDLTTPIDSAITDINGDYFIDSLLAGNYVVGVIPNGENPQSSEGETISDGTDNNDNGSQTNAGDEIFSNVVNLAPNTELEDEPGQGGGQDTVLSATNDNDGDMTIDFGLVPYVSVGSTVFEDANNDGIFDETTEEGIEGITVNLYADANMDGVPDNPMMPIETVVTDGMGNYLFDSLAIGDYVIGVVPNDSLPLSSTGSTETEGVDNNDNGSQVSEGDEIFSNTFNLTGGSEPTGTETGQGNGQDDANSQDANGDMTIDFGVYGTYDVALDKEFASASPDPIENGSIVNYTITITNEGTLDLYNIGVTDNIPTGLTLVGGGDFMMSAGEAVLANPISGLAAGTDTVLNISFTVDNDFMGTQIVNVAEVTSIENAEGEPVTDIDSAPDNEDGAPYEDDEDQEVININQTFDLALVKVVNENQVLPLEPGQAVTFDILVINQGTIDATDVQVSDYIPSGLTINDGNWIEALDTARLVTPLVVTAGDTTTVSITFIVDADFTGESITNNAEIESAMNALDSLDVDSTPGDADGLEDPNNDDVADTNGGDDNDPATIPVDPYVSIGSTVFLDNNNDGLYDELNEEGIDGVKVTVYADTDMNGIPDDLNDPLATVTTDMMGNYFVDSLLAGNYVVGITPPSNTPQSSDTTDEADNAEDNDDNGIQVVVGGVILSPSINLSPNTELEDEPGQGGGQDTVLSATNDNDGDMTIDFGLVPYLSVGSTVFGDANNDGTFDEGTESGISGITVNLYTDEDMDGIPDDGNNPTATTTTDEMGNYVFDSLLVGDYIVGVVPNDSLPLSSSPTTGEADDQVDNNDNGIQLMSGDEIFSNSINLMGGAEPVGETGQGGDQDDANSQDTNGDMTVDFGLYGTYDLAIEKSLNSASTDPIAQGSTVTFDVTVTNEGSLDAYNVAVIDNIPDGLTLDDANWTLSGDTATLTTPIASIARGASETVQITFTVDMDFMGTQITNVAQVSDFEDSDGNTPTDTDSTPNNDDGDQSEDDEDPETINLGQTFDLALVKVVNAMQVLPLEPGQDVTFDISVINQGGVDATDVQISDYIPTGLTLNDANWTMVADTARLTTPIAAIAAGDTSTVSITFTVDADFTGESITNNTEIESAENALGLDDEDSTPGDADGVEDPNDNDVAATDGSDDNDPATILVDPYVSIGSTVFSDNNNNGTFDEATEEGIDGVTVNIYEEADMDGTPDNPTMPIATTTTDINGDYFVDSLLAGNYVVGITPPTDTPLSSAGADATDGADNNDNGIQANPGNEILSNTVALAPNTEGTNETGQGGAQDAVDPTNDNDGDMTVDFGLVPYVSVGSTVFGDADNDGMFDEANESPIEGVIVSLYADADMNGIPDSPTMPIETVVTDGMGNYLFDTLLPGNYVIGVMPLDSLPLSSTPTEATDNQTDNDDNGIQAASGDEIFSPSIALEATTEPTTTETGSGATQDDANGQDANGDMTVDFGLFGIFDLALIKEAAVGPYAPGETVKYSITVFNQGTLGAYDIQVSDYIPEGLELVDANWILTGNTANLVVPIPFIEAGMSVEVPIKLKIADDFMDSTIINNAEIEFGSIVDNSGINAQDIDSTPGNEDGSTPDPIDNDLLATDGSDDYDPVEISILQNFDLALIKVLNENQPIPIEPGASVTFDLLVINQGTLEASNVQLSDYIPNGLTLDDSNWIQIGDTARLVTPISNIAVGDTATVQIGFVVDPIFVGTAIINNAEIESADNALDLADSDSPDFGDQDGNVPDPNDNDVTDTNGSDDYDPAEILVDPYVSIGSTVFTDNNNDGIFDEAIESGISGVTVYVYDAMDTTTPIDSTVTDVNGDYFIDSLLAGEYVVGIIPPGETPLSSTIDSSIDGLDNNDNGIQSASGEEILSNVVSLSPNTEVEGETGQGGGQDTTVSTANDNDGDMTIDFGLTPYVSIGSTVFGDANNDGTFDEGTESGVSGITVNLYTDEDMDGIPDDGNNPTATTTTDEMGNYVFDSLLVGDYIVGVVPNDSLPLSSSPTTGEADDQVDNNDNGIQLLSGDEIFSNSINLMGGTEPAGETGQGGDQDDANSQDTNGDMTVDFGLYGTYDLAIEKSLNSSSTDPIAQGSTVTFDVTVTNEGTLDAYNVAVIDNIPSGLTLTDANWTLSNDTATLTTPIASIARGEMETVQITFTVDMDFMGTQITNVAQISDFTDLDGDPVTDTDSTPNNDDGDQSEDDEDPETINLGQTFDLALIKTVSESQVQPIEPGQDVTFDISVINQGSLDATDVQISDYIPTGLILNDANWMMVGDTARLVTPIAEIVMGDTATVSIIFTLDANFTGESLINNAEIESSENALDSLDVDSTPGDETGVTPDPNDNDVTDTNGSDDYDPAEILVDPYVSIGSTVFTDNNNDGIFDEAIESGISGVTVYVYDAMDTTTPIDSTVTDVNGDYFIDSLLAGEYVVGIIPPGETPLSSTIDSSIDGLDNNDNGIQSASGEEILSNVVSLSPNTEVEGETGQGGGQDTTVSTANDNDGDMTIDFGLTPYVSIGSTVFGDANNDGTFDEGTESGVSGITVNLYTDEDMDGIPDDGNNPTATTTTDEMGNYVFDSLLVGDYIVGVVPNDSLPLSSSPTTGEADDQVDNNDNGIQLLSGDEIFSNSINLMGGTEPAGETGQGGDQDDANSQDTNGDMTVDFGLYGTYDLAIEKSLNSSSTDPIAQGSTVTFDVTVTNEGTLDAYNVAVIDNIPSGLTLTDANWTLSGDTATLTTPIASIARGEMETVQITFTVDMDFMGTQITNVAQISDFTDVDGDPVTDTDSTPNNDDGDQSEDDEDPETINLGQTFDLALTKMEVDPTTYGLGDTVTFSINVLNQGSLDATDVQISDYVPNGLILVPGEGWTMIGDTARLDTPIATIAAGASEAVEIKFVIDPTTTLTEIINNAEIESADNILDVADVDSPDYGDQDGTTPDPLDNDEAATDGSDDYDPATIELAPYVSIGSTVFSDVDNNGMFDEATEEGLSGITVSLYTDEDMDGIPDDVNSPTATTITDAMGNYLFDSLLVGDYVVGVTPTDSLPLSSIPTTASDDQTDNDDNGIQVASGDEIFSPSINLSGDSEPAGETGQGGDQDDANDTDGDMTVDFGLYGTYDLAIEKSLNSASTDPIAQGSTVIFDVIVTNEGTLDAYNVAVIDNIPSGLTLTDANWTLSGDTATLTTPIASIARGEMETVQITFTVDMDFMGTQITNVAQISDFTDEAGDPVTDEDSTPNNDDGDQSEDDEDPETINLGQTFDLALIKTVSESQVQPIEPGQDVTFDISVINQGSLDATDVQISDYIPTGLILNDANWMMVGDTARLVTPIAEIVMGDTATVSIIFTLDANFTGESLINNAEIGSSENALDSLDVDSTPGDETGVTPDPNDNDVTDTNGSDDYDPAEILVDPYVSIGSTVFTDNNNDGIFDEAIESGISGVTVYVYDAMDTTTPIDSTVTDVNGDYFIDSLLAGEYVVGIIPPGRHHYLVQ